MRAKAALIAAATVAFAGAASAETLVIPVDHSQRLSVRGAAASVVVGNPAIADVAVVDSHTVYVSGRGFGSTSVVVLDQFGRPLFSGDVEVTSPGRAHVAVYRATDKGTIRTDLSCDPGCGTPAGMSGGGGATSTESSPLARAAEGAISGFMTPGSGSGAGAVRPTITPGYSPAS